MKIWIYLKKTLEIMILPQLIADEGQIPMYCQITFIPMNNSASILPNE